MLLWTSAMVYIMLAGIQDLVTRRVYNLYNLLAFAYFLTQHILLHSLLVAIVGGLVMAILFLVPSWKGKWGVGDYKVGIVLGTALGFMPALLIWALAMFMTPLKRITYKLSTLYLTEEKARTIPLVTLMSVATVVTFGIFKFVEIGL